MEKPIRLIKCLVHYDRVTASGEMRDQDCRSVVIIPSNVKQPTMAMAAIKALRDQVGEAGAVCISSVRIARYSGVQS